MRARRGDGRAAHGLCGEVHEALGHQLRLKLARQLRGRDSQGGRRAVARACLRVIGLAGRLVYLHAQVGREAGGEARRVRNAADVLGLCKGNGAVSAGRRERVEQRCSDADQAASRVCAARPWEGPPRCRTAQAGRCRRLRAGSRCVADARSARTGTPGKQLRRTECTCSLDMEPT
jgi:hypothetical protein